MTGKWVRSTFRAFGLDIVRYSPEQRQEMATDSQCKYRDFVAEEALTLPAVEKIKTYEVKIEGEDIFVKLD